MTTTDEKMFLTVTDLAEITGMTKARIYRLARLGRIPGAQKTGTMWIFPRSGVDRFIESEAEWEETEVFKNRRRRI